MFSYLIIYSFKNNRIYVSKCISVYLYICFIHMKYEAKQRKSSQFMRKYG